MKEAGCSDLWDIIIDRYCTKEEKDILHKLNEYDDIEFTFGEVLQEIKKKINAQI